ncbi:TIGR03986 family CRISPR-associated RAMP protein [Campylobacter fetus]|uniref:TIGR03986 family type III CRISPR-associated RAMP protein n=1 Tax=Campylobacter fetus TaxID=196 RepID=UPI000818B491|nr:TIGR03986 family CRISPR-associated RAMP protein [Campylobacter fetus]
MITAPYNFVPLNEQIFYPDWADNVSHDIPFSDAQSGEIDITITAKNPIFIKNHTPEGSKETLEFCSFNGEKFIPASSLKGVIRTALEIISYSKLNLSDKTLSYRDLNNDSYKRNMNFNKIHIGWLYKDGIDWKIDDLGRIKKEHKINYESLKEHLAEEDIKDIKNAKYAYEKYKILSDKKIGNSTLVFTGSTGKKDIEFLFPNTAPDKTYKLSQNVVNTFKEAYYIKTPYESKDWKNLWEKKFNNGEKIPVFFQLKEKINSKECEGKKELPKPNKDKSYRIEHFGLSMLYKLPYKNSLNSILQKQQEQEPKPDLAQTIFGYVSDEGSLKGRVYFSNLPCTKEIYEETYTLPLSSPRATFYPNYLVQDQDRLITYDNKNAKLRGFKLYPPRQNLQKSLDNSNKNILTTFSPLETGSTFIGKIKFHNLKKVELGALLSALTFLNQNQKEQYYHKIGMAKGYGFGSVSIKIDNLKIINLDISKTDQINNYINLFIQHINKTLNINLLREPRIQSYLKLSSKNFKDHELNYMPLKNFAAAKKNGESLYDILQKSNQNKNKSNAKKIEDNEPNNPFGILKSPTLSTSQT